ncbi:winged helix DNA-binding domain-containing protein [Nocardioides acrostichi]|uniref:AlkZ family DNA glycosylase n=1 Tax=Nocardioides acrostichi TaxID=2784339 RepID=A0A930YBB9_9ACTN|nr:winged helix DNA-binding domain-containing protein [Nocardioides acrostichi]MBF4160329.1 AlkZ family DNA glycosylase [Nocardioides acrostichi]
MRSVTDDERRARLARRHAVAPVHRVADAVAATRAMTVLHATEPATVHLSVHARVDDFLREDLDTALETERSLVRQLAMRRTMFVFPRDLLPATWASAAARTGSAERARLAKDVERAGVADDGLAWLAAAERGVLEALNAAPEGLTMVELRAAVPLIDVRVTLPSSQVQPGRVLTVLGAEGTVVRGANTQHWRVFRPRWTTMSSWLGEAPARPGAAEGYAELVRRWLATFGPGTETDLVWWLGATKGAVRAALAQVGAVQVRLDGGEAGYVLPGDPIVADPEPAGEPWAALLPVLDPTVMGWKERGFYLSEHAARLFDRNGNAGTTAWWCGRVVGCWVQSDDGAVEVRLLDDVGAAARAALSVEAARLERWLAGERVGTVYPSSAMRDAPGDLPYPAVRA